MSAGAIAGSIAAPIIGGIVGNQLSQGDRAAADELRRRALAEFANIEAPSIEDQKIFLEQLKSQGLLTPEIEQIVTQGDSEFKNVSTDPRLKQAQLQALAGLQDVANNDGMSATDRVRFNQMQSELNRNEGAQRESIMQDMARRGQAGSGMELAAQLMNQQGAAERSSQQGMEIKAQAERRALEALMQGGQLAGSIRGQDYSEQARAAEAQDAINRFNAANRQSVLGANVDRRNDAQAHNLGESQRIADANVGLRNQQQMHNKGLIQQDFDNKLRRASGLSGQYGQMADSKDSSADRTAQMWAGIGSGAGQAAAAYGTRRRKE